MSDIISMDAGDDLNIVYTVQDETGAALGLTGSSVTWKALVSGTTTAAVSKATGGSGITLTTPGSGVLTVDLDPSDTSSLSGTFVIEGKITDASSNVYTFTGVNDALRIK